MSLIKAIKAQLGLSNTATQNFTLDASAADGTMKLARGNAGATTQDILTVDASGNVNAPVGIQKAGSVLQALSDFTGTNVSLANSGYQKLPSGLIVQWGSGAIASVTTSIVLASVALPISFPTAVLDAVMSWGNNAPNFMNIVPYDNQAFPLTDTTSRANLAFTHVAGATLTNYRYRYIAIGY